MCFSAFHDSCIKPADHERVARNFGANIAICGDITFDSLFPQPWNKHNVKDKWRVRQSGQLLEWIVNKEKALAAPRLQTDESPDIKSMVHAMASVGAAAQKEGKPVGPLLKVNGHVLNRKDDDANRDENMDGGVLLEDFLSSRTDDTSKFLRQCLSVYQEYQRLPTSTATDALAPPKKLLKRKKLGA